MTCTFCGKPIVLVPSAEERARKYGQTPGYYRSLFTSHVTCALARRARDTSELMARITTGNRPSPSNQVQPNPLPPNP